MNVQQLGQKGTQFQNAVPQKVRFSLVFIVCRIFPSIRDNEGGEVQPGVSQNLLLGNGEVELVGTEDRVGDAGRDISSALLRVSVQLAGEEVVELLREFRGCESDLQRFSGVFHI